MTSPMIYHLGEETFYFERTVASQPESPTAGTPTQAPLPPLLFLHGATGSMREFDALLPSFNYRDCLLLDLPTRSQGTAPRLAPTTRAIGALILQFLQSIQIPVVDIIGYGLGASIGIEMALESPATVRSIISHAMKFDWTDNAIDLEIAFIKEEGVRLSEIRNTPLAAPHHDNGAEATLMQMSKLMEDFKVRQLSIDSLRALNVPLLISVGDRDQIVPLTEVLSLYQSLGYENASLTIHPNCSHAIATLSPDSFERAARQFWDKTL